MPLHQSGGASGFFVNLWPISSRFPKQGADYYTYPRFWFKDKMAPNCFLILLNTSQHGHQWDHAAQLLLIT
jgi:hypothetical protein